jgi:glucuronate isomerase
MSRELALRLFAQLDALELVDPHTHIPPLAPAARNLGDILGYHYFTELAHSAGLPREQIEAPGLAPREKVRRLVEWLPALDNTAPYAWLLEMARTLWGFSGNRITRDNWEELYDRAEQAMTAPDWPRQVLQRSRLRPCF